MILPWCAAHWQRPTTGLYMVLHNTQILTLSQPIIIPHRIIYFVGLIARRYCQVKLAAQIAILKMWLEY